MPGLAGHEAFACVWLVCADDIRRPSAGGSRKHLMEGNQLSRKLDSGGGTNIEGPATAGCLSSPHGNGLVAARKEPEGGVAHCQATSPTGHSSASHLAGLPQLAKGYYTPHRRLILVGRKRQRSTGRLLPGSQ